MENKIEQTTSSIQWKIVMKLANVSCNADGSWNISIHLSEKQESVHVPINNTIHVIPIMDSSEPR